MSNDKVREWIWEDRPPPYNEHNFQAEENMARTRAEKRHFVNVVNIRKDAKKIKMMCWRSDKLEIVSALNLLFNRVANFYDGFFV